LAAYILVCEFDLIPVICGLDWIGSAKKDLRSTLRRTATTDDWKRRQNDDDKGWRTTRNDDGTDWWLTTADDHGGQATTTYDCLRRQKERM